MLKDFPAYHLPSKKVRRLTESKPIIKKNPTLLLFFFFIYKPLAS